MFWVGAPRERGRSLPQSTPAGPSSRGSSDRGWRSGDGLPGRLCRDDARVGPECRLMGLGPFHPAPLGARRGLVPGRCPHCSRTMGHQGHADSARPGPGCQWLLLCLSSFNTKGLWERESGVLITGCASVSQEGESESLVAEGCTDTVPTQLEKCIPLSRSAQDAFLPRTPAPSCPVSPAKLPGPRSFLCC